MTHSEFLKRLLLAGLVSATCALAQTEAPSAPADSAAAMESPPETAQENPAGTDSAAVPSPAPREAIQLKATVIRGSKATAIKRQAYNVNAIDVTKLKEKNVTVQEVLAQSSGVVVREEGGMGSGISVSLNGMSGNQVRTFLDGLPIDTYGPSMSMGNLPANSIETIEVYKGVVPIHLGADALGGAINISTTSRFTSFLDASYALSSFNTHRATATAQWVPDSSKTLVKAGAFYNYSDNDYKVRVRPLDGNGSYLPARNLRRFHDGYSAYAGSVETGVFQRKYADLATVGYSYGFEHDDIQHAASMDRVYGMVFSENVSHVVAGKYRKRDLLLDGLNATAHVTYSRNDFKAVDTAARIYDWYGNHKPNIVPSKGESQWEKIFYVSQSDAIASNVNLAYAFAASNEVAFNYSLTRFSTLNYDQLDVFTYRYDKPSVILNHVYAGAYKKGLFDDRWSTTVFAKLYRTTPVYRTYDYSSSTETVNRADRTYPGYGIASTLFPTSSVQTKISYENAVRIPESDELFGNGVLVEANTGLTPERSHNVNLGWLYGRNFSGTRLTAESNVFYRGIQDLIRQEVVAVTSRSVNQSSARITGIDGEMGVDYRGVAEARVNATYEQAINTTRYEYVSGAVIESDVYLDRIPNRPYLYGNAYLAGHWNQPAGLPGKTTLSMDSRFVKSYFLYWESQGDAGSKFHVPGQITHSLSLVYSAPRDRYSLALECENLTDENVYDNFRQQKPGRTLSAKLRFTL